MEKWEVSELGRWGKWEGSAVARSERWEGSEVARWKMWLSSEEARLEIPDFIQGRGCRVSPKFHIFISDVNEQNERAG